VRRALYRLPELLDMTKTPGVPVYYVEGEKDVEAMRALGFTATTHAGGAGAYRKELLQVLPAGQRLIVVPDRDDPGMQLMRRVFADGRAMGHDVGFLLIPMVNGVQHKDISEWLEAGLDIADALKEVK
jgi:DNA primase